MKNSRFIALGGVLTALNIIILYMSVLLNFNKLFFLFISSCIVVTSIIITDKRTAFISYMATSLLSLFLLSANLGIAIVYILIFGAYPFIKLFLESCRNAPIEFLLKLLFVNLGVLISFLLYSKLFADIFAFNFSVIILIIVLQVLFIVYDYALTTYVVFITKKFKTVKKMK
ncbi:hypothetical protein [Oceanirhabdus sp. W0125-5]|uniref:hypothetical protein n=1 Tax=Oceanirhabdus sp. W0125-5 TaxID=2999116 RepID=UPI0022F2BEFE|nr:hypothetical protein [Oceanirhabdus sp. W0125-5]WBW98774.1 hypothetical protein OW730_08445 [Oceanirhabdus sp. W0125-5]